MGTECMCAVQVSNWLQSCFRIWSNGNYLVMVVGSTLVLKMARLLV